MADLMAGPRATLTKAFLHCGWRCLPVDWYAEEVQGLESSLSRQPGLCMGFGEIRAAGGAGWGIYSREPRPEPTLGSAPRATRARNGCATTHSHDPKEWEPVERAAGRFYPNKEEAEYTAPLCFALAVRTGRAVLRVSRMLTVECVGRREDWLQLDPRAMREWAMAPVALSLDLRLRGSQAQGLPVRRRLRQFWAKGSSCRTRASMWAWVTIV